MAAENLTDLLDSLTPNEQNVVREFIDRHPELLRWLAQ